jgi:pyrimidine-specific ribonucleoside hydrolase
MTSLIIDTDPGVDDAFAIALACNSPEVDLLAVTTVFGNASLDTTTRNATRLLALCGREDVPVGRGAARPLVYPQVHEAEEVHGNDGLSGRAHLLPERRVPVAEVDAVSLLAQVLRDASEPVTIVPIGPLTNIALLLAAYPSLHDKIARLVIMGGALGGGNTTAVAEFNLWSDPEAARRVLVEERVPTTLVTMDLTFRCRVHRDWLNRLESSGALGETLVGFTTDYIAHYTKFFGEECTLLHDAVAVAEAIQPGLLRTTNYPIEVDTAFGPSRGALVVDRRSPEIRATFGSPLSRELDLALDANVSEVRDFLLTRLAR